MNETKRQRRERLQAAGLWDEYLKIRQRLGTQGMTPREARDEALRQIDARPPHPPEASTTAPPGEPPDVEVHYPRPRLCPRCSRVGLMICAECKERDWQSYAAFCRAKGVAPCCRKCIGTVPPNDSPPCPDCEAGPPAPAAEGGHQANPQPCALCSRFGQPTCPACYRKAGTVTYLRAIGFPDQAEMLEAWINRWHGVVGPDFEQAQMELHGRRPRTFSTREAVTTQG